MSNPIFGHPSQQHQPACRGTAVLRWAALPSRVKGDQNKACPKKSMVILCMDRILHQLVDGSSHCWQGFTVTNWKSCVLEKKDVFWRQSLKSSTITSKNRGINQKKQMEVQPTIWVDMIWYHVIHVINKKLVVNKPNIGIRSKNTATWVGRSHQRFSDHFGSRNVNLIAFEGFAMAWKRN